MISDRQIYKILSWEGFGTVSRITARTSLSEVVVVLKRTSLLGVGREGCGPGPNVRLHLVNNQMYIHLLLFLA